MDDFQCWILCGHSWNESDRKREWERYCAINRMNCPLHDSHTLVSRNNIESICLKMKWCYCKTNTNTSQKKIQTVVRFPSEQHIELEIFMQNIQWLSIQKSSSFEWNEIYLDLCYPTLPFYFFYLSLYWIKNQYCGCLYSTHTHTHTKREIESERDIQSRVRTHYAIWKETLLK